MFEGIRLRYSSENKLLLNCIAAKSDKETVRQTREIFRQELDWMYILRIAQKNRIASLLYHNLQKLGVEDVVPVQIWQSLAQMYYSVGYKNVLFYDELKNILHSFEDVGIKVVVLKGAALSEGVWENLAVRQMSDIDLLVLERDLDRADEKLLELGYKSVEDKQSKDWYRRNHHHLAPHFNPDKGIVIEIHYEIIPVGNPFNIDICKVWERIQAIKIGDVDAQVLSPEVLIVHLCLQLSYANPFIRKIMDLADISQVVGFYGERIDWDLIIKEAHEQNFTDFIYYPLCFARDILGVEIENEILDRLKNGSNLKPFEDYLLRLIVKENILLRDDPSSLLSTWILSELYRSICKELIRESSIHNKIGSLLRSIFLPSSNGFVAKDSYASLKWPASLFYPILRLWKLIFILSFHLNRNIITKIIINLRSLKKLAR